MAPTIRIECTSLDLEFGEKGVAQVLEDLDILSLSNKACASNTSSIICVRELVVLR